MRIEYRILCLTAAITLVMMASCKPRSAENRASGPAPGPSPAEVRAARDAMTRGMQEIAFDGLAAVHVGKQCVVAVRAGSGEAGSAHAPPPLGMVLKLGRTTIYKGEIQELSGDRLKIRAPYPTSGRYKTIEVPRSDIESIHLAP